MPGREPDVPADLQKQIDEISGGSNYDDVSFVDALPDDLPDECPHCDASLSPSTVFVDANEDAVAVRLICKGSHEGAHVAMYIYEVNRDELYLEKEKQPRSTTDERDSTQ